MVVTGSHFVNDVAAPDLHAAEGGHGEATGHACQNPLFTSWNVVWQGSSVSPVTMTPRVPRTSAPYEWRQGRLLMIGNQ